MRAFYRRLLETALAARAKFIAGFLVAVAASFALAPYLGQNFFPPTANTQIKLHVRAPTGTRIEGTAAICDGVEAAIRRIIPPEALGPMVDNIGLPVSGINSTYNNSGTVGPADADILITINPAYESEADGYVTTMRETLPKSFPGTTFAFLPADIVSQILNFGLPSPIDVQVVGANFAANRRYAGELLEKISRVPGVADARIQQAANNPTLGVDVDRMRAAQVGLNEGDVAKSLQETLSGSFKVAPTFWINPKNGVAYPIVAQTPQYWLNSVSSLENIPASKEDGSQIVGGLATLKRGVSPAVVSHYAVQPVIDIYAANQQRDLGAVSADIQRILDETVKDVPPGSSVVMRGQTANDDLRLSAALRRHRACRRADLYADRRQFSVVARSFCDRERLADRACGHRLDAVHHPYDAVRAGPDGRDHVHGRRHRQQHSRRQLRPRTPGRGGRRRDRRGRRRLHPLPACLDDRARDDHRHDADGAQHRAECAARSRRDRRPDLLDGRNAAFRSGGLPASPRSKAEPGERAGA